MNEDIRNDLAEAIQKEFVIFRDSENGSKEKQTALENIERLFKLGLADLKDDTEFIEKQARRELDEKIEMAKIESEKKHNRIRLGLEAGRILAPLGVCVEMIRELMVFQKTDELPPFARTLVTKLIPKLF